MLGVDPEFIVHKLNVDLLFPPKKIKPKRSAKEHVEAVRKEVGRLKEAGAIKEIFFLEWPGEYRGGQEEEWQVESLCRFHGFEPSVPKGPVPYAKDRSIG